MSRRSKEGYLNNSQLFLNQPDEWQKVLPIQAVLVEL